MLLSKVVHSNRVSILGVGTSITARELPGCLLLTRRWLLRLPGVVDSHVRKVAFGEIDERYARRGGLLIRVASGFLCNFRVDVILRRVAVLLPPWCPFTEARDSGVQLPLLLDFRSTPSCASSSLTTASCLFSAAHDSSVWPYLVSLEFRSTPSFASSSSTTASCRNLAGALNFDNFHAY
jgi:hypothetical protein